MDNRGEEDEDEEEEDKGEIGIDEEEEDCLADICSEEDHPGLKSTGLFGRVVRTLSYITWGN